MLPFLDVKVCRTSDCSLTTTVHRKSTHTDKYLDFASHIKDLPSTWLQGQLHILDIDKVNETSHACSALYLNGYPKSFIITSSRPPSANYILSP